MIAQRHADHAGYFCGENVRSGGVIVHTFWQCPERLKVHEKVEQTMREQAQKEGVYIERNRLQRRSNDRRRDSGTAYDDASQDQNFRRDTSRNKGERGWGS